MKVEGFHDPALCWVLPKARLDSLKEFYDEYKARRENVQLRE